LVQANGEKELMPFVILQREDLLKEKLCSGISFECIEKGWMTGEVTVK
jgi:hypothetical protein